MNIITILVLVCFTSSSLCDNTTVTKRLNDTINRKLAFDVFKTKNESMVASPLALRFLFCKLGMSATDNVTKTELMAALNIAHPNHFSRCYSNLRKDINTLLDTDLMFYNKLYINQSNQIQSSFSANSKEKYGVYVEQVSFRYHRTVAAFINRWAEITTLKRLTNVINYDDVDETCSIIMLSMAHMKMSWEFPFDLRLTTDQQFHGANNKMTIIPMMVKYSETQFYDDKDHDFQMISMHLGGNGWTITFVLPNQGSDLPTLLSKLSKDPDLIQRNKKKMFFKFLKIELPRFRIKKNIDWTHHLKEVGILQVFNKTNSGLDAISKNTKKAKFHLSKVLSKISLEVDETGLVRRLPDYSYRDTVVIPKYATMDVKEFNANRPFYFTVEVDYYQKSYNMFCATYYGPE